MDVSVIICTWNRSELLDQTLTQMHKLKVPAGVEWELLVVNNNCSDDTDTVIASHASFLPLCRLFEATPGKSFAANLALSHARGDLLLWTDDDVLLDPNWMEEYVKAAREWPDAMYFGGTVEPWFEVEPPSWLRRNIALIDGVYAIRRIGPVARPIEPSEFPYGVNMAMRRQVFDGVFFDTRLGPQGNTQIRAEDIELIKHFKRLGYQGYWVVTASLHHYVPRHRLTYEYLWDYFIGDGRTKQRIESTRKYKLLFGAPRYAWKRYWKAMIKSIVLSPYKGSAWLQAYKKAAQSRGWIEEFRRLHKA